MTLVPAFAVGATTSSFTPRHQRAATVPRRPSVTPSTITMQNKNPMFSNPFKRKPEEPVTQFMEPQAGDPGYTPAPPVPKGTGMAPPETAVKVEPKAKGEPKPAVGKDGKKLPVVGGAAADVAKRGLALLREDFLKNAPEKAGVGRQDRSVTMKPTAGEPGYKPAAYQTVKVSSLGISPFPDDKNAVGKVGGVDAVVKAAQEVKKGASAKELKAKVLKKEDTSKPVEPKVYDIPDYLKPLPEDTPRKGMTWKNYVGR